MVRENAQSDLRIYWLDNTKFWLISCVVLIHFLSGDSLSPSLNYSNPILQTSVNLILMFCMQLFSFLSGFFTKDRVAEDSIKNNFLLLIVPYIILSAIAKIIANKYTNGFLLDPPPVLWYLPALFIWRTALILFKQIRYSIFIAIICSLAVGYEDRVGYFLSLSRIINFFPFFLLGYFYGNRIFQVNLEYFRLFSLLIFIFAYILTFKYFNFNSLLLELSHSYVKLGFSGFEGLLLRFFQMIVAVILGAAFIFLMSKKETVCSKLGTNSMYPYILHPIVILAFIHCGYYESINLLQQYSLIPISFIVTFLLSTNKVAVISNAIIHPKCVKLLFRSKVGS
ncbi:MAG: hypothetical protein LEGION0398_MBIBDBAK_01158 [Legionellaceae bacterium]